MILKGEGALPGGSRRKDCRRTLGSSHGEPLMSHEGSWNAFSMWWGALKDAESRGGAAAFSGLHPGLQAQDGWGGDTETPAGIIKRKPVGMVAKRPQEDDTVVPSDDAE